MAVEIKKYTIDKEKMKRGELVGFSLCEKGLVLLKNVGAGAFFSGRFDSTVSLNEWGRLRLFLQLPKQCNYSVSVYVSNENTIFYNDEKMQVDTFLHDDNIDIFNKLELFTGENSLSVKNLSDMLLYGVAGRYLWFAVEMYSQSDCFLLGGELFNQGDAFEEYLPQIYQTGGFFRRYMSVFSSEYLDLERSVEQYPDFLNVDVTPDEMLPVLANWIGLAEICKFVSGDLLREFLREGFWLNRNRGTTKCISRVVELFTGIVPTIIERYRFFEQPTEYANLFSKLYGEDNSCFTILLFCNLEAENYLRLKYLVELFSPAKATIRLTSAENMIFLDECIYMDKNAKLAKKADGALGKNQKLDTNSVLI